MAVKYRLKYYDVVNIEHECKIYDDDYSGDIIEIQGKVFLDYTNIESNLDVIRSQGLRVELEANTDLTYDDLYSEEEKTFQVEYYRDSELKFKGWLNPEGWYEDYVRDNWIVSFDCIDGLGYLENLSFVESNGDFITGRIQQIEAVYKALKRTGIDKKIRVAIDVYYTGLTPDTQSIPILTNVNVVSDRYIKDDGDTIMSCDEVIKDILEPYGAVLTSYGDSWYIYKPNELYLDTTRTFYEYDISGVFAGIFTYNFSQEIGSQINNFSIFHVGDNQRFSVKPSIGAYRINYKYGLVQKLLENNYLVSYDGGSTIDDFPYYITTNVDTPPSDLDVYRINGGGVIWNRINDGIEILQLRSVGVSLSEDDIELDVKLNYVTESIRDIGKYAYFNYKIIIGNNSNLSLSTDTYYIQDDGTWGVSDNLLKHSAFGYENELIWTLPFKPLSITGIGYVFIEVYTPTYDGINAIPGTDCLLREVLITPSVSNEDLKGEFHTFKRINKPSAKVENVKEVFTGDNASSIYKGTLYKTDATTPTTTWFRKGFSEAKPILRLMGEETMRMHQLPTRVYEGSVFNYLPILSVITFDNVSGIFGITEYSYDTQQNTTQIKARQLLGNELDDQNDEDFYKLTFDYGETVKPTIEG